ncbi:MAG TPA: substrate-binding domain-containing protein [Candidatus Merdisoma merdipullorum]|nr:substrate-binding domain-containing protein [Candidatus Merdisoma merdipullorum]
MKKRLLSLLVCLGLMAGCSAAEPQEAPSEPQPEKKIQIGLSFDSFVIERWQRDRDAFVARARELGAEVNVQNANGDVEEQIAQIEYLIEKDMDVIVIVAVDSQRLADTVKQAKREGIRVIAYDRLIRDAGVDLYISFDNERIGEMMGESIVANTPEDGKVFMMCGSPEDNNVSLVEKGFHSVVDRTDLEIVETAYADNWLAEIGFTTIGDYLDSGGELDAVMCGNDDIASQVIRALSERRLAGEVCVVGQDADLGGCQRIVEGTQTMTVYKSIEKLAMRAAENAVALARDGEIKTGGTYFDGTQEVPYIGLEPIAVTASNMQVIIDDGYHLEEDIYLNVNRAGVP